MKGYYGAMNSVSSIDPWSSDTAYGRTVTEAHEVMPHLQGNLDDARVDGSIYLAHESMHATLEEMDDVDREGEE